MIVIKVENIDAFVVKVEEVSKQTISKNVRKKLCYVFTFDKSPGASEDDVPTWTMGTRKQMDTCRRRGWVGPERAGKARGQRSEFSSQCKTKISPFGRNDRAKDFSPLQFGRQGKFGTQKPESSKMNDHLT